MTTPTSAPLSIELISTQSQSITAHLSSLFPSQTITSDEELAPAAEALSQIAEFLKRVERARISLVKPLNDHVSSINTRVKAFVDPVKKEDVRIRDLMSGYRADVVRKRREEYEASLRQVKSQVEESGEDFPIPEIVAPIPVDTSKSVATAGGGSVNFMTVWDYEVENLELIPRKYFKLDEALISKLVKAGERSIMGIKIFSKQVPVVKG